MDNVGKCSTEDARRARLTILQDARRRCQDAVDTRLTRNIRDLDQFYALVKSN